MSTSSPTHYCWPGCGCLQELMRLEQPGRFTSPFEHEQTVLPTFETVKFGTIEVNAGSWYVDGLITPDKEQELNDKFNTALLAIAGPELVGELMQGLLWFLFDDE